MTQQSKEQMANALQTAWTQHRRRLQVDIQELQKTNTTVPVGLHNLVNQMKGSIPNSDSPRSDIIRMKTQLDNYRRATDTLEIQYNIGPRANQ